jgi:pyruvate dehydrogenase E2 component (dihydrolipoamide acetyltransferase)
MATVVIMPKQGQSVESCILTEMKKKKGDFVAVGDILFMYETDKASFEEASKVAGTVLDVFFAEGDEIPVLTNVLVIGNPGESSDEFRPAGGKSAETAVIGLPMAEQQAGLLRVAHNDENSVHNDGTQVSGMAGTISPVSPRARALADKNAIQAETLAGTGPRGRVVERDVQAAIAAAPKTTPLAKAVIKETGAPLPDSGSGLAGTAKAGDVSVKNQSYVSDSVIQPLTNMRKLIAKAMHASLQNSAQLTHHLGADARNILNLRKKVKQAMLDGFPADITINDFVCFAVINALKKYPNVNAHFLGDSIRLFSKVHLGLAVDTERGLMVPAIRNADDLSLQGLANQLKEVANACKKGGISPDLLSPEAASFTVSNLGNYGVEIFTPVINLPQVAILGVNTIVPRPKDLGDGVYGFVPYMGLSLTYDHRALDGGEATRFVKQVAIEIENIEFSLH